MEVIVTAIQPCVLWSKSLAADDGWAQFIPVCFSTIFIISENVNYCFGYVNEAFENVSSSLG